MSYAASQFARILIRRGKERRVAKPTQALSIYYPFALVELLEISNTDEHEETGEVLLYFLDSDGCQVTVRLTKHAVEQLCRTLLPRQP